MPLKKRNANRSKRWASRASLIQHNVTLRRQVRRAPDLTISLDMLFMRASLLNERNTVVHADHQPPRVMVGASIRARAAKCLLLPDVVKNSATCCWVSAVLC